jgi:hypothetical protein
MKLTEKQVDLTCLVVAYQLLLMYILGLAEMVHAQSYFFPLDYGNCNVRIYNYCDVIFSVDNERINLGVLWSFLFAQINGSILPDGFYQRYGSTGTS